MLNKHIEILHKIARELMEKETLEAEEFASIMSESGIEANKA